MSAHHPIRRLPIHRFSLIVALLGGRPVVACVLLVLNGAAHGQWEQIDKLAADDAGIASGSAYVFDAATGEQLQRLCADDAEENDWLGMSVSVSNGTVVAGAHGDDDAGIGSGSAHVFRESAPCRADLDHDGVIGAADIPLVLAAGGACDGCPEDINGNGKVNIDDVFEILGAWGPCL